MTADALLAECAARLAGIGEPARAEAARIVAWTAGTTQAALLAHGEREIAPDEVARIRERTARRAAGEPLAYIFGEAWFYGRRFAVDPRVLVPRPETEHLIDELRAIKPEARRICDVGTGSGAIAVTLALVYPEASVTALDVSAAALAVAESNAHAHGVAGRVAFRESDLLTAFADRPLEAPFDALVANLPYIPSADVPAKPKSAGYEPRLALDGGPSGIELYETLLAQAPPLLCERACLLLEAAPPTIVALAEVVERLMPPGEIRIAADYAGQGRYVVWRR